MIITDEARLANGLLPGQRFAACMLQPKPNVNASYPSELDFKTIAAMHIHASIHTGPCVIASVEGISRYHRKLSVLLPSFVLPRFPGWRIRACKILDRPRGSEPTNNNNLTRIIAVCALLLFRSRCLSRPVCFFLPAVTVSCLAPASRAICQPGRERMNSSLTILCLNQINPSRPRTMPNHRTTQHHWFVHPPCCSE